MKRIRVGKKWPVIIKKAATIYVEKGYSASQIVKALMIHNHCVVSRQSVYKLMRGTNDQGTYPRTRKILQIHKSVIDQQLQKDPEKTSKSLQDMLNKDFGLNITTQHISKIRRELGWTAKRTQYCQMISSKNRLCRVDFCLKALSSKDTFENVIFTDETSVEMSATGKIFFYKKRSDIERLPAKAPKPKHPYKVHMWGGISYRGRTRCCLFTGIMDSKIYQEILTNNLLPSVEQNFPDGFRLYQDNDSKHVSKSTKEWMQSVQILDSVRSTPASSPDLNPIENVWAALKDHLLRKVKPRTKEELVNGIVSWWENLTPEKCGRYIDHIHRVIPQVVLNYGGPTIF